MVHIEYTFHHCSALRVLTLFSPLTVFYPVSYCVDITLPAVDDVMDSKRKKVTSEAEEPGARTQLNSRMEMYPDQVDESVWAY